MKLIDIYKDEMNIQLSMMNQEKYNPIYFSEEPQEIHSMREMEGFV